MEDFDKALDEFFNYHGEYDANARDVLRNMYLINPSFGNTLEEKTALILKDVKEWEEAEKEGKTLRFEVFVPFNQQNP